MPKRSHSALLIVAAFAAGLAAGPAHAAENGPAEVVARVNAALIEVMRNADQLGYQGRYRSLEPVLTDAFNLPLMAAVSVGKYWRELDGAQRGRLVSAFSRMSVGTFASRFDGYGGERFEILGNQKGPRKSVLVRNQIVKSDGETVQINYLLKTFKDRWRVVDIYLDAKYSEMALRRSEYTAVVANEGLDGLIRRIEQKLSDWAAEGERGSPAATTCALKADSN